MPKRSGETEEERKWRKIRKMERKISKYKDALTGTDPEALSILDQNSGDESLNKVEERKVQEEKEEEHQEEDVQLIEEGDMEIEEELPAEILAALGEGSLDDDGTYGPELKTEVVTIFNNILTDGLNKELLENLTKTKIPKNAKLLHAPKLNSEFSGLLNNSLTNRDNVLKERQQELGKAIALLTQAINGLTKKEFDKIQTIKSLSDSVRLLSYLHHQYTQIRRKLITPFMDKSLIQNLSENKRSEFLYSELEDSIKTSSAIKRTINILKPKNTPKNYQSPKRPAAQNQYNARVNNTNYKPRPYQNNQTPSYKPQRSLPRPAQQSRPARRQTTSRHRGGRAKYP